MAAAFKQPPGARPRQDRLHAPGLEPHLGAGEPQRGPAGGHVRLVADAVGGLLRRRAVVAQAVGLDDEVELRPEEVDPVAVDLALGKGPRQTGAPCDREEQALEVAVGERERPRIERAAQGPGTGPPHAFELCPQRL
jgi:hypothetical protein